nr:pentapeptide repeat-containing protein [Nostoc sp. EkiNYC01]
MKASELLKEYKAGRRDFHYENLRGQSFKGQDLSGADFSQTDIRGANFTNTILREANFSHSIAGLQLHLIIILLIVTWFLSALLGFITTLTGLYITNILIPINSFQLLTLIPWLIILGTLLCFFVVFLRKKLRKNSKNIIQTLDGAISVTFSLFGSVGAAVSFTIIVIGNLLSANISQSIGISIAATIVAAFVSAYSVGLVFAVAGVTAISNYISGLIVIVLAFFGGIIGIQIGGINRPGFDLVAIIMNLIVSLFAMNGGWKSLKEDETWSASRSLIIGIAARFGTNFSSADLASANFYKAVLKNCNLVGANLIKTRFYLAKAVNFARTEKSYLENPNVRQWLIKGVGEDKNFDRLDLRGINLQETNLVDASFIGADLSEANLQDADLSRAKLVQTQLDRTDLTGATLTGAYIEDWGITGDTKLHGVKCEYVYMRFPTKDNPDPWRKPDNRKEVFRDGDFADFIKPIVDTLDLYHNQDVDPRAIAVAYKKLAENNPEAELEIVAIEKRGEEKILLKLKTSPNISRSQLSAEYFLYYNELKKLVQPEFERILAEKDNIISELTNFVKTALHSPKFIKNYHHNQGDTTMTENRTINTGGGNYNENIGRDYIQGNYYAAGQPQSLVQAAAEIQALLKQLETTYPADIPARDMVVATEVVKRIESDPTWKQRVIAAVKEGGLAAFEKAIDNPAGAFITGAIKGWQEVKNV